MTEKVKDDISLSTRYEIFTRYILEPVAPWERKAPGVHQVFISYNASDATYAQRLYFDLRAAGQNPWIEKENLLPGQSKKSDVEKAIRKSDYFISLFSRNAIKGPGPFQSELRTALNLREVLPESRLFFIPARLDDAEIPYEALKDINYIDMFPSWEDGLRKILQA